MKNLKIKFKCLCDFAEGFSKSLKNLGSDPHRDWRILSVLFLIVFIIVVFFSYRFLWTSSGNSFVLSDEIAPARSSDLNISDLNKVLNYFNDREKRLVNLESSWSSYVDPSI